MKVDLIGNLYVIAAPSGAGKTSLVKALIENQTELNVAISHTTRPRRPHEQDGLNYHFVSAEQFARMEQDGEFIESAQVFNNKYGTSWTAIHSILASGKNIILEIDWQGANQIRKVITDCILIFILPPSLEELQHRLLARGQDHREVITQRMSAAVDEISNYGEFDYIIIINDKFDDALSQLKAIIKGDSQHLSREHQEENLKNLLNSLLSS